MKKLRLFFISSLLLAAPLTACNKVNYSPTKPSGNDLCVTGVTLDVNYMSLEVGETLQLIPTITYKDDKEVSVYTEWRSSNEKVALVSETGFVSAISGGTAFITFIAGYKSASCEIVVPKHDSPVDPDDPPVPGEFTIRLNSTAETLQFGETFQLIATTSETADVSWNVTSGGNIVTVDSNGLVTAGSVVGNATVTATANEKTASCVFTVEDGGGEDDERTISYFFFIDYNNVDETDTTGNRLLAHFLWYPDRPVGQSGLVPSDPTVAPTSDFPYFIGWSDHAIIDSKDGLIDVNTYTSGDTRNFIYIFGIWADVQKGEF